jgi:large subunit ribosomal protein L25
MAESVVLVSEKREPHGSAEARRLRRGGKIPGVLYGHKEETIPLAVPRDEFVKALRQGARVVDLEHGGTQQKALIREVQFDHLGHDVLHVDFARVSKDERIKIDVRVELRGTAPGVTAGGLLDQPLHNLQIECLAISVPESIRVPIGELQIDGVIHVRDLKLPDGVVALNDPDAIIVHVKPPVVEAEAAAAPAAEQAEPEVIGKAKGEGEEGE